MFIVACLKGLGAMIDARLADAAEFRSVGEPNEGKLDICMHPKSSSTL